MKRSKAEAPPAGPPAWELWLWAGLFLALALVPDQKLLRAKVLVLEAGVLVLCAAWLWWQSRAAAAPLRRTPLDLPVLLYAASGLVFFLLSPEPRNSETELARVLFSAATFFMASQALFAEKAPWRAWAAGAALAGAWALWERLGGVERPFASFGNPIFLGTFLAASIPLTVAQLSEAEGREQKILSLAVALELAGLWHAQSRAAFGGLLAVTVLWAAARLTGTKRLALLGALALSGAALLAHFWTRRWTHALIWEGAWRLYLAHPLMGCGLGRFHLEFPAFAPEALKALWPQERLIVNFAHNEYLQVLAETGPLGLAAFALLPAAAVRLLLTRPDLPPRSQGLTLAALALFACALFSPDLRFGASSFAAFAALGAAAGAAGEAKSLPSPRPLALVAAAVLLAFWARLASRPILAYQRLKAAPDFHASAPDAEEAARLEAELAASPLDPDLAEKLGYLYAKQKDWPKALSRYELAARLDPSRPGPANNLGNLYYLAGDRDHAIQWWERSLALSPRQKDARLNLAKALFERGRLKEAAKHLEKELELDPEDEKARVLLKKMVE